MRRKPAGETERIEANRLAMQLGQQFQQIIGELLLTMPIPDNFSFMEKGVRQAMVELGNTLLTTWLSVQNDRYPADTVTCVNSRPMCTTHSRVMCTTHDRVDVYHLASVAAV
ncbi:MAG: hypothetical protein QUS33_14010 [Dehalococcoidia bacterium]|nr:hypothetical protein [Dehalococcoidia bacterium]